MNSKHSKRSKLQIKRVFTTQNPRDPYEAIVWELRSSQIHYAQGRASQKVEVRAPSTWSQIAVDIMAQKYACKVEGHEDLPEHDIECMINRVVDCWVAWGEKLQYFDHSHGKIFGDELKYMLVHQMASPNSPQWFNTGLFHRYGIKGNPNGHFFYDEESGKVVEASSAYERPQSHACFIQSVEDTLLGPHGITDLWKKETRLFKYGSGTGTNFSKLRGKGEPLSGGGSSSGLMSWLEVSDKVAGAIKSGGTTRRAAKMVCLDLDHPEIEAFISWKVREEEKVAAMVVGHQELREHMEALKEKSPQVYQKYHGEALSISELNSFWEGEAYQTVSGQNSNNSIRIPNEFFDRLDEKGEWELTGRVDGKVIKTIPASKLWEQIAYSAWSCADPGLQFSTTINEWHTCPTDGKIEASNPCSEYMFLDDTACNLASLNLIHFWDGEEFKGDHFEHACRLWTMVLDISVSMASYPSQEMAKRSIQYRTLGLGVANLGGLLMRMGLAYDSPEACAMGGAIASLLGASCYHQSALLAQELGAFERYEANRESMLHVLSNHLNSSLGRPCVGVSQAPMKQITTHYSSLLLSQSQHLWQEALALGKKSGLRNAQVTAIAPTGTIGLLMDCDTTGIEPEYSWAKVKSLAGGGQFRILNQSIEVALTTLKYSQKEIKEISEAFLAGGDLKKTSLQQEHYRIFQTSSGGKNLGVDFDFSIPPKGHLNMMAAVQPYISGAISKTLNLSHSTTVDEVKSLYRKAHSMGLKAIALYRDGSKLSQPLMQWQQDKVESEERSNFNEHLQIQWVCPLCGMQTMIPSGTCYQCENCGESSSC